VLGYRLWPAAKECQRWTWPRIREARSERKAGPPVHDDLVKKVFTAAAPNLVWLTDITEHATSEGKLYLCAIKDV
jgi:transposase InsO family protein